MNKDILDESGDFVRHTKDNINEKQINMNTLNQDLEPLNNLNKKYIDKINNLDNEYSNKKNKYKKKLIN